MAEALGLIASVVQLAGTGLKLSQALYQYADGVANADRRIKEVAKEIKLTSFVIEELGNIFKQDATLSLISDSAVATANETLKECSTVFEEIETTLNKSRKGKMGRLMLPFRENKIELLRNHIDKLKSTLQLLMQVLLHANQVASNKIDREAEARQRDEIRQLLEEKKNTTKRYEESLRNFAASDSSTEVGDDESSFDDKGSASMVEMKAIGSTLDSDSLAVCMEHVRTLLESMERLQQAIANTLEGDDYSDHQQAAIGSYFVARSHLDSILLGNSSTKNLKDTEVPIREPVSMKTSTPTSDAEPCAMDKKEEGALVFEASITTNVDEKTKQTTKSTYLQRLKKSRKKSVPEQAPTKPEVVPRPPPVIPVIVYGGSGGSRSSNTRASYSNRSSSPRAAAKPPILNETAPTFGNAGARFPEPGLPPAFSPFSRPPLYVPNVPQENRQQGVMLEAINACYSTDSSKHNQHAIASDMSDEKRENTYGRKENDLLEAAPKGDDEVDDLLREWTTCFA